MNLFESFVFDFLAVIEEKKKEVEQLHESEKLRQIELKSLQQQGSIYVLRKEKKNF